MLKTAKKIIAWCWATLPRKIISSLVILGLLLSSAWFLFFKPAPVEAGWFDEDWLYRIKITIDQTKIDADLTNFPVLVKLTSSQLTFSKAQSNGQDIRFTDYAGNLLKYEIERWDSGSSLAEVWVKIPNIDDARATYFYMYYGNPSALDDQNAADVWDSNYKGVWHMNTTSWLDSTSNDNDGTGAGDATTTTSGKIDSAGIFDGTDDTVNFGDVFDTELTKEFSISGWVNLTSNAVASVRGIWSKANGLSSGGGVMIVQGGSSLGTNKIGVWLLDGSAPSPRFLTTATITTGSFVYLTITWDGTTSADSIKVYFDGVKQAGTETDYGTTAIANALNFVFSGGTSSAYLMIGSMDEVGIWSRELTQSEITGLYNSGNNTLLTYGSEEKGLGPVLWLKFDEGYGTTAYDFSEQGNDFTLSAASWTTSGKFARAWDGDGTKYLSRTDDADFDFAAADNFSISGWFKHDTISATDYIVAKHESGTAGGYKVYMDADGDIVFAIDDDGTWGPEDVIGDDQSKNYDDNTWHHFMAVKNGTSSIKLYVDGIEIDSDSSLAASGTLANAASIYIGIDADGSTGPFDGELDEIKIYSYARSVAQIKRDYNQGFAARLGSSYSLPAGLIGYWRFERGSGLTAYDSSDQGNDGTLQGDTSWTVNGKYGTALDFDGTGDYVTTPYYPSGNSGHTVVYWLKPNFVNKEQLSGCNDGSNHRLYLGFSDSNMAFFGLGDSFKTNENATGIIQGAWYMLAMTGDGSTAKYYVNAIEKDNFAYSFSGTSTDPFIIGEANAMGDVDGLIDNVMIFDRALSADEITGLYQGFDRPGSADATTAHWKFDEGYGTTAYDASGRGNDLTLSAESYTMSGKFGRAWDGDGTKYLSRADDADFDFAAADDFSITGWFKHDTISAADYIIAKHESGTAGGYKVYMDADGDIAFAIDDDGTWGPEDVIGDDQSKNYDDNTWHHFTAVKTGTTSIQLYIDGISLATDNSLTASGTLANAASLYIGIDADGTTGPFDGELDEIKIYRFALSADDVKLEYNRAKALQLGAVSTDSDGTTPSHSQSRAYCPPGYTGTCNPPIGEWKMDEYSGSYAYDTSANTNKGTLAGNPTWKGSADCKYGSCLFFDGDGDYVDTSDSASQDFASGFTLSAWAKPTATDVDGRIIYRYDGTSKDGYYLTQDDTDNGYWQFVVFVNPTYDLISSNSAPTGDWQHIVGVREDDGTLKLYVDGVLQTDTGTMAGAIDSNDGLRIGIDIADAKDFNGTIDNVIMFNYAMTQEQIAWLYNHGKPVGYWKFNEGEGGTAKDSSENNNTGTITNATWTTSGKYSSALSFDGSGDYVEKTSISGINNSYGSISLWIKPNFDGNDSNFHMIIELVDGGINYYNDIAIYKRAENDLRTIIGDSNSFSIAESQKSDGWNIGEWHHIVMTWDIDGYLRQYHDGIEVANDIDDEISSVSNLYIGADLEQGLGDFNGTIDEVKIYNYALTAQQVKLDYNQGAAIRFGD